MNRALQTVVGLYILGISGVFLSQAASATEPRDPRLGKILADWQKRQHWFEAVEYTVSGIHKVPKGAYNIFSDELGDSAPGQVIPPRDVEAPVSFKILLDFVRGRHRRERSDQVFNLSSGSLNPSVATDVFNGSVMKIFMPREGNPLYKVGIRHPDMSITFGNMKNGQFVSEYFPFFLAHGRIYTDMEPILPGQLRNKPNPEYIYVHGQGVYENHPCLLLRTRTLKMTTTTSFDEYWVDTTRESAIMRYLSYSGKNVSHDLNIHYDCSHGHWLPESWFRAAYLRGSPLCYEEIRVKHITVNPPIMDADFELEVTPGMLVEEVNSLPTNSPLEWPKNKISVYRVKENGEREDVPDPFHRPEDQYQAHRPRRLVWLWIVSFVVVGSFGIFWIRYRKSAKR